MLLKILLLLLFLLLPLNNVLAKSIPKKFHGLWEGSVSGVDIMFGGNKERIIIFSAQYYLHIIDESHAEVLYRLYNNKVFQYKELGLSFFLNSSSGIVIDRNGAQLTFGGMTLFLSEKNIDRFKVKIYGEERTYQHFSKTHNRVKLLDTIILFKNDNNETVSKIQKTADGEEAEIIFEAMMTDDVNRRAVRSDFSVYRMSFQSRHINQNDFRISDMWFLPDFSTVNFTTLSFASFEDANGKRHYSSNPLFALSVLAVASPMLLEDGRWEGGKYILNEMYGWLYIIAFVVPNMGFDYPLIFEDYSLNAFAKLNTDYYLFGAKDFVCIEPRIGLRYLYKNYFGAEIYTALPFWSGGSKDGWQNPYLGCSLILSF